ncbi:uncharacterized protein [Antedon mediterranea]|uniref:uncharacterized protein n=1 Tax=Antedon mediterranea TaxID=105859 RepID=UPI003AF4368C
MFRYSPDACSPELQFTTDGFSDDMTMEERLHRWIDQELAAELERTAVVSNLPSNQDDLLNKLEEYLSKSANCAGYIERIEYLDESSAIIVFFESKVCTELIAYSRENGINFLGASLKIETLYEYEHNQNQDNGNKFKGSLFGETTVNITKEWLPDVNHYFERINEMALNLGLQSTKTDTGCYFSGNFEILIQLRNKIEWLMFDERGVVVNQDEHMDIEPMSEGRQEVPLDHIQNRTPPTAAPPLPDDVCSQTKIQDVMNYNPVTSGEQVAVDDVKDDSDNMECDTKADNVTRSVKFEPDLIRYAMSIHAMKVDEIRQTCYVKIQCTDNGAVEISLSDSVPGTETDVDNAVDLLKLLFSEIEKEMSVHSFDLGKFDVSENFRETVESTLMNIVTMMVVRQSDSNVLRVYGQSEAVKEELQKAEDMLSKEMERETNLKIERERKEEAERKEKEARDAEEERRKEELREAELREAYARELEQIKTREAQRIEAIAREEQREALAREVERNSYQEVIKVETAIIPQTQLADQTMTQNHVGQDQPLPPPSTGDKWLEPINEHQLNDEYGDSIDGSDDSLKSNGYRNSEVPSKANGRERDYSSKSPVPVEHDRHSRKQTSPTSTLRPLNPRFHAFLSRNFFQSTGSSSEAYMYDTIFNGVHITVKRGDIAKERAAVIVSSNDVELSCGGAISSTIDKNSGSIIHARCLEWMDAYGLPAVGQIVEIESEGVLPCNKVFFIVMPNWNADQDQTYLESQLRRSCKNILQKARDTRNVSSVAIPGLGTGRFYFPCDVYARIMTDALKEFLQAKGRMLEIRFIDLNFRVLQALQREFQSRLKHPEKAGEYEQSLSEIYRQTTDNGEPLPTGFVERTPPSGFEKTFRRQSSENFHERERKWVKKYRTFSDTADETKFESCVLCTRRVSLGFFGYIPCKHIICHICSKGMELHEKRACPTCFKSFSKLQISKF